MATRKSSPSISSHGGAVDRPSSLQLGELLATARAARDRAYVPYSGFQIGAAVLTSSGEIIPGSLVENVSLGLAMCAERVALFASVAHDVGVPVALALVAPRTAGSLTMPCGACLQVALELGGPELLVIAADTQDEKRQTTVSELAPSLPYKPKTAGKRLANRDGKVK
jgi:cytidine deaminase